MVGHEKKQIAGLEIRIPTAASGFGTDWCNPELVNSFQFLPLFFLCHVYLNRMSFAAGIVSPCVFVQCVTQQAPSSTDGSRTQNLYEKRLLLQKSPYTVASETSVLLPVFSSPS